MPGRLSHGTHQLEHDGVRNSRGLGDTRGMTLEGATRTLGVAITVVGAFVVSPAGFQLLVADARTFSKVHSGRFRNWLSRRLPRLFRTQHVEPSVVDVGTVSLSAEATLTATATIQATGGLEQRVKSLEDHLTLVNQELAKLHARADQNEQHAERRLLDVRQELQKALDVLSERVTGDKRTAVQTDARALPVVALGALLIGLSPELGKLPFIAWPVMAFAVFITFRAVRGAWRDAKTS